MRIEIKLLLFLLFGFVAAAQEPVPAQNRIELNVAYSLLRNQDNRHGYQVSASVRLSPHWAARFSRIAYNAGSQEQAQFLLGGVEYRFSGSFLPRTEQLDTSRLELFATAQVGAVRQNGAANNAFSIGGGADLRVNDTFAIRLASIDFLRGQILQGNGLQRNRAVLTSGINLRF